MTEHELNGRSGVKIHCWGGFGSQLHAVFLFRYLKREYPKKRLKIIFHSSGVSSRFPQVGRLVIPRDYRFVDDFSPQLRVSSSRRKFSNYSYLRKFLSFMAHLFRFVLRPEVTSDLKLFPWTSQLRGSYNKLIFEESYYCEIFLDMSKEVDTINESAIAVHVRAGDLLDLPSKNLTPQAVVMNQLSRVLNEWALQGSISIFSDSPEMLKTNVESIQQKYEVQVFGEEISPISVIVHSVSSNIFIGSNSKLSLWIGTFRACLQRPFTFLPKHLKGNFENMTPTCFHSAITYY